MKSSSSGSPPRGLRFAPPAVEIDRRPDGTLVLRSPQSLRPHAPSVCVWLEDWAERAPERVFLAERRNASWRCLTYAGVRSKARSIGAALLERGLGATSPVVVLSGNGVDHALVTLGSMYAGVPVAPLSPAFSLLSRDFQKLRSILSLLDPPVIFVEDGEPFSSALAAARDRNFELVVSRHPPRGWKATSLEALLGTPAGKEVERAFRAIEPDTVAKILFTSGSTGEPKGVINTHRMLTANQQAYLQAWPFLDTEPPVLVDWLPWSHTFGGNSNFNMVLSRGGTLYIDEGKPLPGQIECTAANLREVAPTLYFNVPRGFDMLLPFLEKDPPLRRNFFSRLKLIFYAGAALPQHVWQRLEALSIEERGERVAMISAWGSTETAPMATVVHFAIDRAGIIGLPGPGCELKLVPAENKLEARVRGPHVTPGYWKRPDLTSAAFDEEGFYRTGDALRFVEPATPARGLAFDGRIAEDFKLRSGTWVHTGALRVRALAALGPIVQDVVVAGQDRDEVGLLIFPSIPACRALARDLPPDAPLGGILAHREVVAEVRKGLERLRGAGGGSSTYATRAILLEEPPSADAGEITDKGYINQRAVLTRRARSVDRLYTPSGAREEIIVL